MTVPFGPCRSVLCATRSRSDAGNDLRFPTNLNFLLHYNAHGDGISFFKMLYCDDNDGVDDAIYCLTQMTGVCVMTLAMDSGWVQFKVLPSDFVGVVFYGETILHMGAGGGGGDKQKP